MTRRMEMWTNSRMTAGGICVRVVVLLSCFPAAAHAGTGGGRDEEMILLLIVAVLLTVLAAMQLERMVRMRLRRRHAPPMEEAQSDSHPPDIGSDSPPVNG